MIFDVKKMIIINNNVNTIIVLHENENTLNWQLIVVFFINVIIKIIDDRVIGIQIVMIFLYEVL